MSELGRLLRQHYSAQPAGGAGDKAEVEASLKRLQEAADALFQSVSKVAQEPEVRAGTERAARAFGSAIAETFKEVGDHLDRAVRPRER